MDALSIIAQLQEIEDEVAKFREYFVSTGLSYIYIYVEYEKERVKIREKRHKNYSGIPLH